MNHPRHPEALTAAASNREAISDAIRAHHQLAIVGPCSDQPTQQIHAEGHRFAQLQNESETLLVMHRIPFRKPRSDPESWKGIIQTEPELVPYRLAEAALGRSVAVELLDPRDEQLLALTSFAWIGARTLADPELLQIAARHPTLPLGIKNGLDGAVEPAIDVIKEITSKRFDVAGDLASPVLLLNRFGGAHSPQQWEEALRDSDQTATSHGVRMIVDLAHGSEQAHDPQGAMQKTIPGQLRAARHLLNLLRSEHLPSVQGIMLESSDFVAPDPSRRTDPNIPTHAAEVVIREFAGIEEVHPAQSDEPLTSAILN